MTGIDELSAARRQLRDLSAALVLTSMWKGRDPAHVVAGMVDVAGHLLLTDHACARLASPAVPSPPPSPPRDPVATLPEIEICWPQGTTPPTPVLEALRRPAAAETPAVAPGSAPVVPLQVATVTYQLFDSSLRLVVASRRPEFPDQAERNLLQVIGEQAALAIEASAGRAAAESARSQAESARQRLHDLFLQAPAAICVLRGPHHVFELANPPFLQLVGLRNLIGHSVRDALPELAGQDLLALLDRVYATGQPISGHELPVRLNRHAGSPAENAYFSFVYVPTRDLAGTVDGILVHGFDVTTHVRALEAQRESERLQAAAAAENDRLYREAQEAIRARDAFVAAAAHDLRTPLAALKANSQLLRRRAARGTLTPTQMAESLEHLEISASRMATLLDELLDVARLRAGQPPQLALRPADLVALAQRAVATHRSSAPHHSLRLETSSDSLLGEWDEARLERVLDNLLDNAIKYSPEGGEVLLRLSIDKDDAVLSIQDYGLGIPEAELPHIFERFHRAGNVATSFRGTGIGLASARWIVERHGGTIGVQSREGAGSTFTVRLPLRPPSRK